MKNLYEPSTANEVKERILRLGPESVRQWGTMKPAQALAHCSGAMEWAVGDTRAPRIFLGRLAGWVVKPMLLGDDKPMRRNAPTVKTLVVSDEQELETEKQRLTILIDRFSVAGPEKCSTNPHSFFGKMKPQEWAILLYKHVDHHLRQFGV